MERIAGFAYVPHLFSLFLSLPHYAQPAPQVTNDQHPLPSKEKDEVFFPHMQRCQYGVHIYIMHMYQYIIQYIPRHISSLRPDVSLEENNFNNRHPKSSNVNHQLRGHGGYAYFSVRIFVVVGYADDVGGAVMMMVARSSFPAHRGSLAVMSFLPPALPQRERLSRSALTSQ